MTRRPHRQAVSLIELLVVIAIIATLIGLTLSAVQRVRAAAARTVCADRLRQLGLAAHNSHGAHGRLPPGVVAADPREPYRFMGWHTRLLPYLEQEALWGQAQAAYRQYPDSFLVSPPHPIDVVVPALVCPTDAAAQRPRVIRGSAFAFTSYLGVSGTRQVRRDGVLYADSRTRLVDITDGTSQTLLAGERPPSADGAFGWWYAGLGQSEDGSGDSVLSTGERAAHYRFSGCPTSPARFGPGRADDQCAALHFWSHHPGGAHFAFADGAVRFVRYSAADLLPALATRAGGEAVELP
ncbi:MAG: DUF1559 domain-containing protein [Gemmataceae bacterium]|nr:DUF1559 domain-containing protein [Gemmataceae bacterium]